MAFVIADRVRETSTSTGTGNFTLGGAVTGYQTFASVLATADTTYYTIADQGGANWEVGIGTFTSPSTLARTTILSSSNGGSVVTFTSGTKDVFISLPASKTNVEDQPNLIEVNSSSDALRITQTGAGNALVVEDSANPDSSPFVIDASGNVGIGTSTPTAPLDVNGNVAITGTARRITGDMSNATLTNRLMFQTSTANSTTALGILPNGSGQQGQVNLFGGSDPANTSLLAMLCSTAVSEARLASSITGTGTYLPMTFYTGGSERMRVDSSGNVGIGTTAPGARLNVVNSSGDDAVRITHTGVTGNSFVVEDSANPDASPYVIDAAGRVISGYTSVITGVGTTVPRVQQAGTSANDTFYMTSRWDNTANAGGFDFAKSRGGSVNSNAVVVSGDTLGQVRFIGDDGAAFIVAASISAAVDGTPGTNDMPGRLVFSTTADGALSVTERMRIDSSGNVGIGTSSPLARLNVVGAGDAFIQTGASGTATNNYHFGSNYSGSFVIYQGNYGSGTERMRIDSSGNVGIGTSSPASKLDVNGVIRDSKGDVRTIVQNAQTSAYVLVAADAGKHISITTGGVTVNSGIFSAGDAISIYNNSASNQTITQGTSVTMYLGGTATTGNRTLAQRGICTILCVASNTFVISGAGLT
jgi:hypothetical protein